MKWGIDLSEHNDFMAWGKMKKAGLSFAIIRLGWGKGHLDRRFYDHVNSALAEGIQVGIYYYSYALSIEEAAEEARFAASLLSDCGLTGEKLSMGCWLDMEDADGYKERHGLVSGKDITAITCSFLQTMKEDDYPSGLYGNLDWLTHKINISRLPEGTPLWCAQWDNQCSLPGAAIWQFTDSLSLEGVKVDGDIAWI